MWCDLSLAGSWFVSRVFVCRRGLGDTGLIAHRPCGLKLIKSPEWKLRFTLRFFPSPENDRMIVVHLIPTSLLMWEVGREGSADWGGKESGLIKLYRHPEKTDIEYSSKMSTGKTPAPPWAWHTNLKSSCFLLWKVIHIFNSHCFLCLHFKNPHLLLKCVQLEIVGMKGL